MVEGDELAKKNHRRCVDWFRSNGRGAACGQSTEWNWFNRAPKVETAQEVINPLHTDIPSQKEDLEITYHKAAFSPPFRFQNCSYVHHSTVGSSEFSPVIALLLLYYLLSAYSSCNFGLCILRYLLKYQCIACPIMIFSGKRCSTCLQT